MFALLGWITWPRFNFRRWQRGPIPPPKGLQVLVLQCENGRHQAFTSYKPDGHEVLFVWEMKDPYKYMMDCPLQFTGRWFIQNIILPPNQ